MSVIHKKIKTKYDIEQMKDIINNKILSNSAVNSIVNDYYWVDDTLKLTAKVGNGTIKLFPQLAEIIIELNVFGKMAGKTLEDTLDKEFKKLEA
jgi:hypothetical protein